MSFAYERKHRRRNISGFQERFDSGKGLLAGNHQIRGNLGPRAEVVIMHIFATVVIKIGRPREPLGIPHCHRAPATLEANENTCAVFTVGELNGRDSSPGRACLGALNEFEEGVSI